MFYKKFKFLPKILPNKKIFYKTNTDDISNFLKQFLTSKKNIYRCYQSPPEKMVDIFNFRKKILTIPIPWFVLYIILKSFEILKFNIGFRSDSILSIWGKSGVNEKFLKKFKIVNFFYEIYIGISEYFFNILSKVVSFFSNSKIVRRLVFNLLPRNKDFYLDTTYGNFILNTNSRIISKKSYYSKTPYFSKSLIKVFKILEKENIDIDIFVDVGANVGTTSIASANLNSNLDVLCIEGNSSNYSYLEKNIKLNNLENRVTAINSLVGESDNQRYFVEFVEEKGCSKVFNDLDELKDIKKNINLI